MYDLELKCQGSFFLFMSCHLFVIYRFLPKMVYKRPIKEAAIIAEKAGVERLNLVCVCGPVHWHSQLTFVYCK